MKKLVEALDLHMGAVAVGKYMLWLLDFQIT
jgi:hypothetical protein